MKQVLKFSLVLSAISSVPINNIYCMEDLNESMNNANIKKVLSNMEGLNQLNIPLSTTQTSTVFNENNNSFEKQEVPECEDGKDNTSDDVNPSKKQQSIVSKDSSSSSDSEYDTTKYEKYEYGKDNTSDDVNPSKKQQSTVIKDSSSSSDSEYDTTKYEKYEYGKDNTSDDVNPSKKQQSTVIKDSSSSSDSEYDTKEHEIKYEQEYEYGNKYKLDYIKLSNENNTNKFSNNTQNILKNKTNKQSTKKSAIKTKKKAADKVRTHSTDIKQIIQLPHGILDNIRPSSTDNIYNQENRIIETKKKASKKVHAYKNYVKASNMPLHPRRCIQIPSGVEDMLLHSTDDIYYNFESRCYNKNYYDQRKYNQICQSLKIQNYKNIDKFHLQEDKDKFKVLNRIIWKKQKICAGITKAPYNLTDPYCKICSLYFNKKNNALCKELLNNSTNSFVSKIDNIITYNFKVPLPEWCEQARKWGMNTCQLINEYVNKTVLNTFSKLNITVSEFDSKLKSLFELTKLDNINNYYNKNFHPLFFYLFIYEKQLKYSPQFSPIIEQIAKCNLKAICKKYLNEQQQYCKRLMNLLKMHYNSINGKYNKNIFNNNICKINTNNIQNSKSYENIYEMNKPDLQCIKFNNNKTKTNTINLQHIKEYLDNINHLASLIDRQLTEHNTIINKYFKDKINNNEIIGNLYPIELNDNSYQYRTRQLFYNIFNK